MIGMLTIPWTMTAELFPTDIRGIGHSLSYSMANVLMFAAIQSYRSVVWSLDYFEEMSRLPINKLSTSHYLDLCPIFWVVLMQFNGSLRSYQFVALVLAYYFYPKHMAKSCRKSRRTLVVKRPNKGKWRSRIKMGWRIVSRSKHWKRFKKLNGWWRRMCRLWSVWRKQNFLFFL